VWEPPTVKRVVPNQQSPRQLQRPLVRALRSDKSIKMRTSGTLASTLRKALIRSVMTNASPGRYQPNEITAPAKQGSLHHWQFSKVHTVSRIVHGPQTSIHI
jgi:hypothetical protein